MASTELSLAKICSLSSGSYERPVTELTSTSSESMSCCSSLMFLVWLLENWSELLRSIAKPSIEIRWSCMSNVWWRSELLVYHWLLRVCS